MLPVNDRWFWPSSAHTTSPATVMRMPEPTTIVVDDTRATNTKPVMNEPNRAPTVPSAENRPTVAPVDSSVCS